MNANAKFSTKGKTQNQIIENLDDFINKIIEIMMKNPRGKHGGIAWESAIDEVNQFIVECEAKGIMKRL